MKNFTIIEIEKQENYEYDKNFPITGLTLWYDKIRSLKLSELSDGDLARFIRQRIFLEYIVHEAVKRLKVNITIGELYDGEVFTSLAKIKKEFWNEHMDLLLKVKNISEQFLQNKLIPDDFEWITEDCFDEAKMVAKKILES